MTEATSARRAIVLLADSQLLFWQDDDGPFVKRIQRLSDAPAPRIAYIGASNGDDIEFLELFRAAMTPIGTAHCEMVSSCFAARDRTIVASADVIVLAGGDVERGWKIFEAVGLRRAIIDGYLRGALLVGVSAGAVQLGAGCFALTERSSFIKTFDFVPFLIGAHDERRVWPELVRAVQHEGNSYRGLGLPSGSGAIYHPDGSLEPVRHPLVEISADGGGVRTAVLIPGQIQTANWTE